MGTDLLVTVGPEAKVIADRALQKGMKPENVIWCDTPNDVFEIVAPHLDKDTVILVKTSMHISVKGLMKKMFGEFY